MTAICPDGPLIFYSSADESLPVFLIAISRSCHIDLYQDLSSPAAGMQSFLVPVPKQAHGPGEQENDNGQQRQFGEDGLKHRVLDIDMPGALRRNDQHAPDGGNAADHQKRFGFQFLGAGLLGVFLQGFIAEMLSVEPSAWAVATYVVIGFVGIFGVFWSLIR